MRIAAGLFDDVRSHVERFRNGEEAGFLICSLSRLDDRDVLLAREWHPIPDSAIERNAHGSVLSWSAQFNSDVLQHAVDLDATALLIHSHGSPTPEFSGDDRAKERALFSAFSRILDPLPTGAVLLGRGDAAGSFWTHGRDDELVFRRLVVVGETIDTGMPLARLKNTSNAAGSTDRRSRSARKATASLRGRRLQSSACPVGDRTSFSSSHTRGSAR